VFRDELKDFVLTKKPPVMHPELQMEINDGEEEGEGEGEVKDCGEYEEPTEVKIEETIGENAKWAKPSLGCLEYEASVMAVYRSHPLFETDWKNFSFQKDLPPPMPEYLRDLDLEGRKAKQKAGGKWMGAENGARKKNNKVGEQKWIEAKYVEKIEDEDWIEVQAEETVVKEQMV